MALVLVLAVAGFEIVERRQGFRIEDDWWLLDRDLGYRMREASDVLPPQGPVDHVILGDSIPYPDGIRDGFAKLLAGQGRKLVNLSASGYGNDQELLLLRRWSPAIGSVRTLVLSFCVYNDFIDNVSAANPHDGYRPKPYFSLEDGALVLHDEHLSHSPLTPFALFLRRHSATLAALRGGLQRGGVLEVPEPEHGRRLREQSREEYLRWQATGFEVTRALLDEIARHARDEMGAERVLVLAHPSEFASADSTGLTLVPAVRRALARVDADVLDMSCWYRARRIPYRSISFDWIGHLTDMGNHEVAGAIWAWWEHDVERIAPGCFLTHQR